MTRYKADQQEHDPAAAQLAAAAAEDGSGIASASGGGIASASGGGIGSGGGSSVLGGNVEGVGLQQVSLQLSAGDVMADMCTMLGGATKE
jgi:hypothetical protein